MRQSFGITKQPIRLTYRPRMQFDLPGRQNGPICNPKYTEALRPFNRDLSASRCARSDGRSTPNGGSRGARKGCLQPSAPWANRSVLRTLDDNSEVVTSRRNSLLDANDCDGIARYSELSALWLTDDAPDCASGAAGRTWILGMQPLSLVHRNPKLRT
jgi:hypothetical protein